MRYARWLAILGDWAYATALRINTAFNWARRKLGLPYWSLSAYLKHKVKNAVQFIDNYEHAVASEARRRGVDGVVCGHIHHAEIRTIDGVLYCNDGDWVESCTALVEDFDGRLRIVHWAEEHARRARDAAAPRAGAAGGGVDRIAHRHRLRRLATADQRRGAHHRDRGPAAARRGPRRRGVRPRPLPHPALPDLSRDPPVAVSRRRGSTTC